VLQVKKKNLLIKLQCNITFCWC